MPMRQAMPLLLLGGIAAVSASALAGVGIGRYTVSGINPFYGDGYRPLGSARLADGSGDAFWSAQGQPARPRPAAFDELEPVPPLRDTPL